MLREIAGGVIIGIVLGAINISLLRLSVRRTLRFQRGGRAMAFIIGAYALRYLVIALVVIALLKLNQVPMAMTVLAVLGMITVLLAVVQKRNKTKTAAIADGDSGSSGTAGQPES